MINNYNEIRTAIDFAQKYGASTVTIETDSGEVVMSPNEAWDEFHELAPGEAFSVSNIAFADRD